MKAIITADLHLHDWRVPSSEARRDQYLRLAEWLGELAREQGASELYIAGDVFHTSTPSPKTISLAKDFFSILNETLNAVYVTHGQHDLHIRSNGDVVENSILNALNRVGIPFIYLHREWGGDGQVYFYGWEPNYKLPEEANQARAIITHATVVGSKLESGWVVKDGHSIPPEGPPVFAGDIHRYQKIGRIYIPGPPIQHTYGDSPDVGVLVFDLETGEVERVKTGYLNGKRAYSFFAFVSDPKQVDVDEDFLILSERKENKPVEIKKLGIQPLEVVSKLAEEHKVKRIHESIVSSVKRSELAQLRLDISLKRLKLKNFTIHRDLELDFEEYPAMNLIVGPNGSGKSSIFQAIKFALLGGSGASLKTVGEKEMEVELEFDSGGNTYLVRRGHDKRGYFEAFLNGEPIEAPTMSDKERILKSHVPAINDLDLWYWDQNTLGPLSSRTQKERFALLARILGLDLIEALYERAREERNSLALKLSSLESTIASLEVVGEVPDIEPLRDQLKRAEEELVRLVRALDELEIEDTTPLVRERDRVAYQIQQLKNEVLRLADDFKALSGKRCPVCGAPLNDEKHRKLKNELENHITEKQAELAKLNRKHKELESRIRALEERQKELEPKRRELETRRSEVMEEVYNLRARIAEAERMQKLVRELEAKRKERDKVKRKLEQLDTYLEIVSPKGVAMASMLEEVGDHLSNGFVRVRAVKRLKSGEARPHFSLEMKVNENWLDFDLLSGGQKSLAEVTFFARLASIIGGVEDLLLDESFRYLDEDSVVRAMIALTEGGIKRVFLVSHHEVVPRVDSVIRMGR